jgi:hypothetical protein
MSGDGWSRDEPRDGVAQIDILLEPLHSELVDGMTTIRFEVRTQAHLLTFPLLPVVTRPAP